MKTSTSTTARRWVTALVVIVALSLAAGCRWSSADETVLRFWAMGREGEVVAQLLPEFERTHPGIRVTVQQLPWTAAHEKLLTAFAGGTTPDVCQLGNTWIPEFVALKALEPLDRYLAGSSVVQADDYLGIDQGAILAMIENYRSALIWRVMQKNSYVRHGLAQAGFSGGWLTVPE